MDRCLEHEFVEQELTSGEYCSIWSLKKACSKARHCILMTFLLASRCSFVSANWCFIISTDDLAI